MEKILIKDFNKIIFQKRIKRIKYFLLNGNILKNDKICSRNSKIINFFAIFVFLEIYYLYYLSLESCPDGHRRCSKRTKWIQEKLNEGLLCSILLLVQFELIIQKIISKLHFIHIISLLVIFFIYSHGLDFDDHGLFNFLGISSLLIIGNILILPFNLLFYIIKQKNKLILFIYIIILISFLFSYNYYLTNFLGCNDWQKGLNNTFIENDINKFGCQIKIPKYCPYKFMKYFLDITKRAGIKCGYSSNTKKNILKYSKSIYINNKTKIIGFPRTNDDAIWSNKSNENKKISTILSENLLDMENKEILKEIKKENLPEIIVDFSDYQKEKMIINLRYNKSLSLERKKIENMYSPYSNNIIVLYFDSLSRATGIRQLKKTLNFFEKFMPYNSKKYHSFQFFKYHAFRHYTPGNYPKLFIDSYRKKKKRYRITYYLKQYGFVTALSNDMCFNNPYPNILKEFSKEDLCDHEFLICDPNRKHINSMTKRCLYGKTDIDYQYEYGLQFWKLYKDNRKFLMIINNDGHEGTLEVIKYDDDTVSNFLNDLYYNNLLKGTTILLLSDHGCPMPSVYYFNDFFQIERHLPMLFIFTSDKENQTYSDQYQHIHQNQQKFITAYDIYNTLCYLMLGNDYFKAEDPDSTYIFKSKLGVNLFQPINPKRSPEKYKKMKKGFCK